MEDDAIWRTETLTEEQIDFTTVVRAYKILKEYGKIDEENITPEFRSKYIEWLMSEEKMQERWIAVELVFEDCLDGVSVGSGSQSFNSLCERARSIIKRRNEEASY